MDWARAFLLELGEALDDAVEVLVPTKSTHGGILSARRNLTAGEKSAQSSSTTSAIILQDNVNLIESSREHIIHEATK